MASKTPWRLAFMVKANINLFLSKVETIGRENLKKIPAGRKVVIVTTHISDMDVPIAGYALLNDFNLAAAHQSVQTFFNDPGVYLGILLGGRKNFFPIDYRKSGKDRHGMFNPENFIKMKKGLEESDKTLIIAAHNPSHNWQLERGGLGAIFLTQLMKDVIILPVAVNINSDEPLAMGRNRLKTVKTRPRAEVIVGEPIQPPEVAEMQEISELIKKVEQNKKLSEEEIKEFLKLREPLRQASDLIMRQLAILLPAEKRGIYG